MKNRSTGRLGRLFLNAVTLEGRCPGSVVSNKESGRDPGLRHSRMTLCGERRSGFTLIELLVVVLIIGILAAVAVPQYQKVVLKSKVMENYFILRTVELGQKECYMANGSFATDIDNLVIPISKKKVGNLVQWFCSANGCGERGEEGYPAYFGMSWNGHKGLSYLLFCNVPRNHPQKEIGKKICQDLGGVYLDDWQSKSRYILPSR